MSSPRYNNNMPRQIEQRAKTTATFGTFHVNNKENDSEARQQRTTTTTGTTMMGHNDRAMMGHGARDLFAS
jgi:hypothetical protein